MKRRKRIHHQPDPHRGEAPHWFSRSELSAIEARQNVLSATSVTSKKFHGATGATWAGVKSITLRTRRRDES